MSTKRIFSFMLTFVMCFAIVGTIPAMAAPAYSQDQYYRDSITSFEHVDLSDDQFIPDENFFGVWDEQAGDWKEDYIPHFYYEGFPELGAVEEAAKAGDYETCKKEILAYYRNKSNTYNMGYKRSTLYSAQRAAAELLFTHSVGGTVGATHFTESDEWHTINIQDDVQAAIYQGITKRIYALCVPNKDGYRVEISRDDEHIPYISIEVNGERKIYYPTKTTYVDGLVSDYHDLIADKLLVEESVTSIGKQAYARDENTKRAFLQFEFPGLTRNDQIGGVALHLYGKMVEDDIPEPPLYKRTYKMLHVMPYTVITDLPGNFTYSDMGEYTEFFYCNDQETGWARRTNRYIDAPESAWDTGFGTYKQLVEAYTATEEEVFAKHAIRALCYYVKFFGNYEKMSTMRPHHLGTATNTYALVWNPDRIIHSESMTPEIFTYLLKGTHVRGEWLERTWSDAFEKTNHGGYAARGLLSVVMFYPEFRAVHGGLWRNPDGSLYLENAYGGSVRGGWFDVANYRNSYKVGGNMNEDGSSFEAPIGYSFESLSAYLNPKKFGEMLNYDYSTFYVPEVEDDSDYIYVGQQRMSRALRYLACITTPQGGQFQVGDSASWKANILNQFKGGYLEFMDDPELEYIVYQGERGTMPSFTTVAYDGDDPAGANDVSGGKVAVFRNNWDDTAIAAMFQAWGRASHSHQDDLAISLVAYGNYLLTDQLMHNYDEENRLERWVSSTRGHNVVEINDAVGKGGKEYARQFDPIVFESTTDENGNTVPVVDENGVPKVDDPLYVPIGLSSWGAQSGSLFPEDREINTIYDYIQGKTYTYIGSTAPSLYNEDFDQQRNILFLRSGYFIVTDYSKPRLGLEYKYQDEYMKENNIEGHKYKQIWHFTDKANISLDPEKNTVKTNFNGEANIVVATVKSTDSMRLQYKYGLYPLRRGVFEVCKYATFEQYEKGPITFNTLLYPTRAGDNIDVTTKQIKLALPEDSANAFQATISDADKEKGKKDTDVQFYTLLDTELKAPIIFGAYETDGTLALGEKNDNNYVNAVLRHGSYLKNNNEDEYLIYSKDEITDIGVSWISDEIDIAYSTEDSYNTKIDLERLTVKANNKVSKVRLNGEEVEFKQDGKYIYFGDEPILDGGDVIPGTGNQVESEFDGGHASMGGGGSSSGGGGGGSSSSDKKEEEKPETKPSDTETEVVPLPSDKYGKELDGHWAKDEISSLVNNAVVQGYGDGTLGLDRKITRAQFITMLVRALKTEVKEYKESFSDVSKESWYADYMETAAANGWIQGDGKNSYPDRNITREEITKILVAAFEQKYGEINLEKGNEFTDGESISVWAEESVNKAVEAGLINGMGNGEFQPKESAKREQAMVLIHRLINNKQ